MKRPLLALLALALAAALLASCGDDDDAAPTGSNTSTPAPEHVTFLAGFKAQANLPFVGAYVAKEKGFFAANGLDVDIQHVTTPGDNFPLLAAGTVQFSTADAAELLNKRAGDPSLPLVSIALIGQVGQQGFAVLADSGINSPADWAGKTAGYKGSKVTPDYLAILDANHVERDSVAETRVGFDPTALTEGLVDIYPVFISNEPDTLQRRGYATKLFTAADYGAPTLGLSYVTTEDYLADHEDVARRFVKAALQGIAYADTHRDEAIDIVLQYAPNEDRVHQRYMLDTELDMAKQGLGATQGIGHQTGEQWQKLYDFLKQYDALQGDVPDVSAVFRADLVPGPQAATATTSP